ncbi:MAG: DoxX family protein [Gemmatimonadota bacterium]
MSTRAFSRPWAPLPLRVMLGAGLLYHGVPKLFSAEGHVAFVGMLAGLGVPAPDLSAWVIGAVETFGGVSLLLGGLVGLFATLNILVQLAAMFLVHLPHGFNFLNITGMTEAGPQFGMPGYEVNLLYVAGLLTLVLGGPGALALDRTRSPAAGEPSPARTPRPDPVGAR